MSAVRAEEMLIDDVQQQIESQLGRLGARLEQNKTQDREILQIENSVWVAYLEPAAVGSTVEDAIYFLAVGNTRPAYAVTWTDETPAQVYSAQKYEQRTFNNNSYIGFDLAEGCEWRLLEEAEDKLPAAELLEALPA
jgi:hypothetical protein